ncbi:MAG TPA: glycosyltransferase [Bryobacteraceae bacterium]|nr:glycosyltransferase [Bryobacteraceae bacterium]
MPKLLFATTIAASLEGFLADLALHFRAKGWRVDAMASGVSSSEKCRDAFDAVWEVNWSRNPLSPNNLLQAPAQVRNAVERVRFDLVHVHTPNAAFVLRFALRNLRKARPRALIYTAHGFHFHPQGNRLWNLAFAGLERLAGRWTDYLLVINRTDEEAAKKLGIVRPDRLRYLPGIGIDSGRFDRHSVSEEQVADLRRELQIEPQNPVFTIAAEFTTNKRHRDALEALARLKRPDVQLLLAGTGPHMEAMKRLAIGLGVEGQARFLGFRRDMPVLMRASNAVVLCSQREGLPMCVLEAMSLGVPVIGTKIRGTADLLEPDVGLLVGVGDVDGLVGAMSKVIEEPHAVTVMAHKGLQRIRAYGRDGIVRSHESLYDEALRS